jgi:pyroglutamyl-peptidase
MNLLITGFLPFLNYPSNPSEELVKILQKEGQHGLILPVSYKGCQESLTKEIQSFHPDFILSFGYANNREFISLEKKAYNLLDSSFPDENGRVIRHQKIVEGGKKALETPLSLLAIQKSLSSYHPEISIDPGRYCCNEVYYLDLASGVPSLFIHLPHEKKISLQEEISFAHELIKEITKVYSQS